MVCGGASLGNQRCAVLCCGGLVGGVVLWSGLRVQLGQLLGDVSDAEGLGMSKAKEGAYGVCNGLNASVTWGW